MIQRIKNIGHLFLAICANLLNAFPSKQLIVIGVTGTDGKTTTSNLLYHILSKSGKKTAVISTIGAIIDGKKYDTGFHVTTPSPFEIQRYLRLARQKNCSHVILEVTSHALDQKRVWGVNFEIGILTNITHEHLDYHKSYERYVDAKLQLFKKANWAVINSGGEWFSYVTKSIHKDKIISYSLHGSSIDDITLINLPFQVRTHLIGDFNLENILAASATCLKLGIEVENISRAIEEFEPPTGRQEVVYQKEFTVMVDFAHTANSFENILPELRKRTTGRLIHVFGAAGERDHKKRPEMGKAASFYDDVIILTAEDPRSEKVSDINKEIKKGIQGFALQSDDAEVKEKMLFEIEDRGKAIQFAISIAQRHDTIIITGKGHEKSINLGTGEIEWSDQEKICEYLKNIK